MRKRINSNHVFALFISTLAACSSDMSVAPSTVPEPHGTSSQVAWSAWSTPENLGSVLNTAGIEQHPTISKDGLSLYFASDRTGTFGGLDIWVSHRASVDDAWGAPVNLGSNINSAGNELAVAFTHNPHWMYFHTNGRAGCGGADLFVSYRADVNDDLGWSVAENLGCVVNSSFEDAGPTLFEDESGNPVMMFTSTRPGGPGDFDLFQTTMLEGVWIAPTLVAELSSPFRDTRTSVSKNFLTLFMSSDSRGRLDGLGGQDLWMSTRSDLGSVWSTPVNLGPTVNGATFDGAPSISWDGTEVYFFSDRAGGAGKNDLYVTRRSHVHP